jgi:hypothetical protein
MISAVVYCSDDIVQAMAKLAEAMIGIVLDDRYEMTTKTGKKSRTPHVEL